MTSPLGVITLVIAAVCVYSYDNVWNCGEPEHCLCTDLNRLVLCDGPAIDIFPSFSVERVRCRRLIVQNTRITTLKELYIKKWRVLEEISITGNQLIDCAREKEWIAPMCRDSNITLFMPCSPTITQGSTKPSTDGGSTTSSTTAGYTTRGVLTTPHPQHPNSSVSISSGTTAVPHIPRTAAYGAAIALSSVAGVIFIAAGIVLIIIICRRRKRRGRAPQRNIIYNDVYRLTETAFA